MSTELESALSLQTMASQSMESPESSIIKVQSTASPESSGSNLQSTVTPESSVANWQSTVSLDQSSLCPETFEGNIELSAWSSEVATEADNVGRRMDLALQGAPNDYLQLQLTQAKLALQAAEAEHLQMQLSIQESIENTWDEIRLQNSRIREGCGQHYQSGVDANILIGEMEKIKQRDGTEKRELVQVEKIRKRHAEAIQQKLERRAREEKLRELRLQEVVDKVEFVEQHRQEQPRRLQTVKERQQEEKIRVAQERYQQRKINTEKVRERMRTEQMTKNTNVLTRRQDKPIPKTRAYESHLTKVETRKKGVDERIMHVEEEVEIAVNRVQSLKNLKEVMADRAQDISSQRQVAYDNVLAGDALTKRTATMMSRKSSGCSSTPSLGLGSPNIGVLETFASPRSARKYEQPMRKTDTSSYMATSYPRPRLADSQSTPSGSHVMRRAVSADHLEVCELFPFEGISSSPTCTHRSESTPKSTPRPFSTPRQNQVGKVAADEAAGTHISEQQDSSSTFGAFSKLQGFQAQTPPIHIPSGTTMQTEKSPIRSARSISSEYSNTRSPLASRKSRDRWAHRPYSLKAEEPEDTGNIVKGEDVLPHNFLQKLERQVSGSLSSWIKGEHPHFPGNASHAPSCPYANVTFNGQKKGPCACWWHRTDKPVLARPGVHDSKCNCYRCFVGKTPRDRKESARGYIEQQVDSARQSITPPRPATTSLCRRTVMQRPDH